MRSFVPIAVALLGALACSDRAVSVADGDGGQDATAGPAPDSQGTGPTAPPETSGPPATGTSDPLDSGGVDSSDGVGFIERGDTHGLQFECDLHDQDCPVGEKCVPVSQMGGFWNAYRCVPVVDGALPPGEDCELLDPVTGADDCELGAFCWPEEDGGLGVCIELCQGNDFDSSCETEGTEPHIGCQDCFCMCLWSCDPLQQDCGVGQGCYELGGDWQCAPDASMGAGQDAPCEFVNGCSPGHLCLGIDAVPTCMGGTIGCCSAICDTSLPDTCPGQAEGMSCVPFYEEGTAPPGFETVGVCAVMP